MLELSQSELAELQRQNTNADNEFFHDIIRCGELTYKTVCYQLYGYSTCVRRADCHKHNLTVCFCGWEIGNHGGQDSRLLNPKSNGKRVSDVPTIH